MVSPSGSLCSSTARNEQDAEPARHQESARDGDAVEEGVQHQPEQCRIAGRRAHPVSLLAEMEVGREDVLGEVNGEITDQHI